MDIKKLYSIFVIIFDILVIFYNQVRPAKGQRTYVFITFVDPQFWQFAQLTFSHMPVAVSS